MDDAMKEELRVYKMMLNNWRDSYISWLVTGEDNTWVVEELKEDISTWMAPQVRRFAEMGYMNFKEVQEFWKEVVEIVDDFAKIAKEYGGKDGRV